MSKPINGRLNSFLFILICSLSSAYSSPSYALDLQTLQKEIKEVCLQSERIKFISPKDPLEQKAVEIYLFGRIILAPYIEMKERARSSFVTQAQSSGKDSSALLIQYLSQLRKEYEQEFVPFAIQQALSCPILTRTQLFSQKETLIQFLESISGAFVFAPTSAAIDQLFYEQFTPFQPTKLGDFLSEVSVLKKDIRSFAAQVHPLVYQTDPSNLPMDLMLKEFSLQDINRRIDNLREAIKLQESFLPSQQAQFKQVSDLLEGLKSQINVSLKNQTAKGASAEEKAAAKVVTSTLISQASLFKPNYQLLKTRVDATKNQIESNKKLLEEALTERKNLKKVILNFKSNQAQQKTKHELAQALSDRTERLERSVFDLSIKFYRISDALLDGMKTALRQTSHSTNEEEFSKTLEETSREIGEGFTLIAKETTCFLTDFRQVIEQYRQLKSEDLSQFKIEPLADHAALLQSQYEVISSEAEKITALEPLIREILLNFLRTEFRKGTHGEIYWLNAENFQHKLMTILFDSQLSHSQKSRLNEILEGEGLEASDDEAPEQMRTTAPHFPVYASAKALKAMKLLDPTQEQKFTAFVEELAEVGTEALKGVNSRLKGKIVYTFFGQKSVDETFYHKHLTESPISVVWLKKAPVQVDEIKEGDSSKGSSSEKRSFKFVIHDITFDHQY